MTEDLAVLMLIGSYLAQQHSAVTPNGNMLNLCELSFPQHAPIRNDLDFKPQIAHIAFHSARHPRHICHLQMHMTCDKAVGPDSLGLTGFKFSPWHAVQYIFHSRNQRVAAAQSQQVQPPLENVI